MNKEILLKKFQIFLEIMEKAASKKNVMTTICQEHEKQWGMRKNDILITYVIVMAITYLELYSHLIA